MTRLLPLILLTVMWVPVAENCQGLPDDIVSFDALEAQKVIASWDVCTADDGMLYPCPVYAWTPWSLVVNTMSTSTAWDPVVGMGEAAFIRIEQVNAAGRRSDEACP